MSVRGGTRGDSPKLGAALTLDHGAQYLEPALWNLVCHVRTGWRLLGVKGLLVRSLQPLRSFMRLGVLRKAEAREISGYVPWASAPCLRDALWTYIVLGQDQAVIGTECGHCCHEALHRDLRHFCHCLYPTSRHAGGLQRVRHRAACWTPTAVTHGSCPQGSPRPDGFRPPVTVFSDTV